MRVTVGAISGNITRRLFLKSSLLAATVPVVSNLRAAQAVARKAPLIAYVGTFSSPLKDVLPTQVDLPPGNGRGIHLFQINRTTGALTPVGIQDVGTSP